MKKIVVRAFGDPSVMKLEDAADLEPQRGQVVVAIRAVGVNPVETYIRSGTYAKKPSLPYTPGSDAAGVIESVGDEVDEFAVGARVYVNASLSGTYADHAVCEVKSVHQLPEKISFEQGAAIGVPYATAYRALFERGGAKAAETVLVHGASGGVGIAAVQIARAAGLRVIGTASTEKGRAAILENGAHHALDHSSPAHYDELKKLTRDRGVEIIIEFAAHINLGNDLGVLSKNGRVIVVGSRGTVELNPRDAMGKDADIRGMTLMNATDDDLREIHAALVAGLELGTLHPVIGESFSLGDAARAHEAIGKSGSPGKIVLIP